MSRFEGTQSGAVLEAKLRLLGQGRLAHAALDRRAGKWNTKCDESRGGAPRDREPSLVPGKEAEDRYSGTGDLKCHSLFRISNRHAWL